MVKGYITALGYNRTTSLDIYGKTVLDEKIINKFFIVIEAEHVSQIEAAVIFPVCDRRKGWYSRRPRFVWLCRLGALYELRPRRFCRPQ